MSGLGPDSPFISGHDNGGILIRFCEDYAFRYNDLRTGAKSPSSSFWNPKPPPGFSILGSVGLHGHDKPKFITVAVKQVNPHDAILRHPSDYHCLWTDKHSGGKYGGSMWRPIPPSEDYVALGCVANEGRDKPALTDVMCVHKDYARVAIIGNEIWNDDHSGAHGRFSSWNIEVPGIFGTASDALLIGTNCFVGVTGYDKPSHDPTNYVLKVDRVPSIRNERTLRPALTSYDPPPENTEVFIDNVALLPFFAVKDDAREDKWKMDNSPFYLMKRKSFYKNILFSHNSTSTVEKHTVTQSTGVTDSQTKTFSSTTAITVSAESGVSGPVTSKVSFSITQTLGYQKAETHTIFRSDTIAYSLNVQPNKAACLWDREDVIVLERMDGSVVGEMDLVVNQSYTDEYPHDLHEQWAMLHHFTDIVTIK